MISWLEHTWIEVARNWQGLILMQDSSVFFQGSLGFCPDTVTVDSVDSYWAGCSDPGGVWNHNHTCSWLIPIFAERNPMFSKVSQGQQISPSWGYVHGGAEWRIGSRPGIRHGSARATSTASARPSQTVRCRGYHDWLVVSEYQHQQQSQSQSQTIGY